MKKIDLSKHAAQKLLKQRPPWLYRNELPDTLYTEPGEVAALVHQGEYLATAFVNPHSTIAARVLGWRDEPVDRDFFARRIERAIAKREGIESNALRLVHSEADGLPGLVADRYGDNLVLSFTTAGMDRFKEEIVEIFVDLLSPKGIWEKGDKIRLKEGLEATHRTLYGDVDETFIIEEGTKRFQTDLKASQKTGFFLDQRRNRRIVGRFGRKRTLDLFANAGGFGIYAEAESTKFVEISELACTQIETNCRLNGLKNYEIVQADVFGFLEKETERYDLIVVDPPAFAKSKKARSGALKGWKYLIVRSLALLEEGGHMALFSCSHAVGLEDLLDLARSSAVVDGCRLEVVETMKQDVDHPWMLDVPNSLYLTGALLRKSVW
ncbi:class I SAM-dependent rRNA methyltransferase [Hydrogenimonas sp.]